MAKSKITAGVCLGGKVRVGYVELKSTIKSGYSLTIAAIRIFISLEPIRSSICTSAFKSSFQKGNINTMAS